MVEIAKRKEDVLASLANAEDKVRDLRDYLMSTAFRLVEASAKDKLLDKTEAAISELKPGIAKISELLDEILL